MRRVFGTTVSGALVAIAAAGFATGASAQISNVTGTTAATQKLEGVTTNFPNPAPSPNYDNGGPGGAGYSASADITPDSIFFQAGSMAAGKGNGATSSVTVLFDVTNPGPDAINKIKSTIFESNFGFYVGNFAGGADENNVPLPNCSGSELPNCVPVTFSNGFSGFTDSSDPTPPRTLASTQFTFEILQDGNTVRTVSGSMDLVKNGDNSIVFTKGLGFDDLSSVLNNFSLFEVSDRVYAWSWDRTNFTAELNDILSGDTSSVGYRISTSSQNFGESFGVPPSGNLIVAFSCFADPIGRGGTSGAIFTIPNFGPSTCNDYGANGDVSPYSVKIPVINGDTIDFTAPNGVIPEPDTWAMLIIGFGLVGLSMRRSKKPMAATVTA
jgi:hypothetical protein